MISVFGLRRARGGIHGLAAQRRGPGYRLLSASGEDHETPCGTVQQFTAVLLPREL
ncbi:MAG: hypothetical protein M3519_08985 [Actinomycetota bacterium]|nr:hypothetical protein [Actinomycetota bacterium]